MHTVIIKMKTLFQICAIVAAIVVVSNATKVQKCSGEHATDLPTVDLQDCDGNERCVLYRGQKYDFTMKFKAPADADTVKANVIGKAFGQEVTVRSGNDDDACKSITRRDKKGKGCPLTKGTHYVYDKPIQISKNEFQLRLTPEWRLVDGNNKTLSCFKVAVQVKEKS